MSYGLRQPDALIYVFIQRFIEASGLAVQKSGANRNILYPIPARWAGLAVQKSGANRNFNSRTIFAMKA